MIHDDLETTLAAHAEWLRSDGERGAQANLPQADLAQMDLHGLDLSYAVLRGASLRRARLDGANLRHADLTDADLSYADCRGARLDAATLYGTRLEGAVLNGASFRGTALERTDLRYAQAQRADFTACTVVSSNLSHANLVRARFVRATLEFSDFRNAVLTGADFDGVTVQGNRSVPGAMPAEKDTAQQDSRPLDDTAQELELGRWRQLRQALLWSATWLCLPLMTLALLLLVGLSLVDAALMIQHTTLASQLNAPYVGLLVFTGVALLMTLLQLGAALLIGRLMPVHTQTN